jgi:hypothetical protein
MSSHALGKNGKWSTANTSLKCLNHFVEVDYGSDKFIHAPMYTYNEVICSLELVGVAGRVMSTVVCLAVYLRTSMSDMS